MKTVITNIPRPGRGITTPVSMSFITGTLPTARSIKDMIFCPALNKFVAYGNTTVCSSSDGLTWISKTHGSAAGYRLIHDGQGTWLSLAGNATTQYKYTVNSGSTFGNVGPGGGYNVYHAAAYRNGTWYLGTDSGGVILSSSTPSTGGTGSWTAQSCSGESLAIEVIAADESKVVAMTIGGNTWIRHSGSSTWVRTWYPDLSGAGTRWYLEKVNNLWMLGTANGIYTSTDVINWVHGSGSTGYPVKKVCYSSGTFIAAVYSSSFCLASRDGLVWNKIDLPITSYWSTCAAGNGVFTICADELITTTVVGTVI
jgi:hypothetical protein